MALNVEDGTGLVNADSYVDVFEADAYLSAHGITIWENMTVTEKEQALRRATSFMVQRYRARWKGYRANITQSLDWPRCQVYLEDFGSPVLLADNSVPREVKNACAELALRASIAALSEDQSPKILQETVGPVTVKYDPYGPSSTIYTAVVDILKPFMKSAGGGGMMKLTRC